ncbi:acyl-CoA dehydrogenase [Desulfoluna limicola]|uniref:Acyl-CoA dehydrogenase n=1 Tax=Desulfoluna limicola TaxID=2810562 RepID=A0ABM7PPB9_9BACT|nr:acyl-CoA dehydrogenase family protein [Desulfoluna limicola]BCS98917.1 acyl-CoA dehydrogenase [Desulfoluna limicola]
MERQLKMVKETARDFARRRLVGQRESMDRYPDEPYPMGALDIAWEMDLFHMALPESCGGLGLGLPTLACALEALSEADAGIAAVVFADTLAATILQEAGETALLQQRAESAKGVGEWLMAVPLYDHPRESENGPVAERDGDTWRLTGTVKSLSPCPLAASALVMGRSPYGLGWFSLALDGEGVTLSDPVVNMGLNTCPVADLTLARAPARMVGGEPVAGPLFERAACQLEPLAAAMALGIMKGAFEDAWDYAKNRHQGGRAIVAWSEVTRILSEMALKVETSSMLLEQALRALASRPERWEAQVGAASLHIRQSACDLSSDAVQILGGVGYMKDFAQEKRFRDAHQVRSLLGSAAISTLTFIHRFKAERKRS